jgi:hypothetical protein
MRKLLLSATLITTAFSLKAQNPVWSTDVAPILYNKCASCHRTGGIAPFSLLTYTDAQSQASSIKAAVSDKRMPPWPPDASYSALAHERILSQQEIAKISQWASNGTPQGDPNLAPPQPTFNPNGDLPGTPDLISTIPNYTSTATGNDIYQCFVVPSNLSVDKYLTAIEAIPGNRSIVHHVQVFADTTGICAGLDAASPGPGYPTSGGGVGTDDAELLCVWVPGGKPIQMPSGFGIRIPKNADLVIQVHYPAGSNGQSDATKVNMFFSSTPVRTVNIDPILNHFTNISSQLFIPANQTKTFTESFMIPINGSLLGIMPHMHLIGRNISTSAVTPTGDTQRLIRINDWDFNWQGFYMFKKIKKVAAGSTLYSKAFYDNTTGNPYNPSNPPVDVSAGEATKDEMMLNYFIWTYYQNGDENIVIDTSASLGVEHKNLYSKQELFAPYPNPANNQVFVKCYFDKAEAATIEIMDMSGKVVSAQVRNQAMKQGYNVLPYNIADLPNGTYILQLTTAENKLSQKLLIQR